MAKIYTENSITLSFFQKKEKACVICLYATSIDVIRHNYEGEKIDYVFEDVDYYYLINNSSDNSEMFKLLRENNNG